MGIVSESAVSLRFVGDALDPDEITKLLGGQPTDAERKGDAKRTPNGREITARTGAWHVSVERRRPADVSGQIHEIIAPLTDNLSIWRELAGRFRAEIFCGLFLAHGNEGMSLPPETLRVLADRHLTIDFDIYRVD